MNHRVFVFLGMRSLTAFLVFVGITVGQAQVKWLSQEMVHLRNADPREWSEFGQDAQRVLNLTFDLDNAQWSSLQIRQRDVRQTWEVQINGAKIGTLVQDEKDLTHVINIPQGKLVAGKNTLRISTTSTSPDDILVGGFGVYVKSPRDLLSTNVLTITVGDKQSKTPIPARITLLDTNGSMAPLVPVADESHLAARTGCVYTATGKAVVGVLPGRYKIYATRGFEYGVDSATVDIKENEKKEYNLNISREVDTRGWVSVDTHVHTFTHSGHGDATELDRVITLAGEGIELPIAADHNKHIDLEGTARLGGVRQYFTPVVGNEVTTSVGHFNVFPVNVSDKPAEHRGANWNEISSAFRIYSNEVIILNHANDIHNNFRPFDPAIHISAAGYGLKKWSFPANAMEVMNSGSQQTDIMKLFMNWFGMINGGQVITPIGSSDSHDVSRFIVGQGRTYVKANDTDPGKIDINDAVNSIRQGRVMVSSGLLTSIVVNGSYGPGDLVPKPNDVVAEITVSGPSWVTADHVMLFANGELIREEKIESTSKPVKWTAKWKIDTLAHDSFLVAIATGPGDNMPFWPLEKPYQPTSPDWTPKVIGATGAVWIDGDGNGKPNTANLYAGTILRSKGGNIIDIVSALSKYDKAVATQVAIGLWVDGKNLSSPTVLKALESATPATKAGFEAIRQATDPGSRR